MRLLGLDVGEKRIGVALSDPLGIIASPFTVILRKGGKTDYKAIVTYIREQEVELIVVGLPRSMDGSLGHQAQKVQAFIQVLEKHVAVSVEVWDERLSTVAAKKALVKSGVRGQKRKEHQDAVAAALILQGYLDRQRATISR